VGGAAGVARWPASGGGGGVGGWRVCRGVPPRRRGKCSLRALRSQSKHTPYAGYELSAQVRATLVGGRLAFERSA